MPEIKPRVIARESEHTRFEEKPTLSPQKGHWKPSTTRSDGEIPARCKESFVQEYFARVIGH